MTERTDRVGELIKREVSDIIQNRISDPRLGFVTVMYVKVSKDLQHAKVYVSILGEQENKERSLKCLTHARGFIQSELGRRIVLRYMPKINFYLDNTIDYSIHISEVLDNLKKNENPPSS